MRAAAGARLDELEMNMRAFIVRVTTDRHAVMDQIAGFVQADPALVAESPFALIGTPAELVDDLLAAANGGASATSSSAVTTSSRSRRSLPSSPVAEQWR